MGWDDRPDEGWFAVDARGREEPASRPARRGPSFLSVLLGLVAVAIAAVAWVNHSDEGRRSAAPTPSRSSTSSAPGESKETPPPAPASGASDPSRPVTTELGRPPLGPTAPWDLFALGNDGLVRIEMASGRITTTRLQLPEGSVLVPFSDRVLAQNVYEGSGRVIAADGRDAGAARFPAGFIVRVPGTDRVWWAPTECCAEASVQQLRADGSVVGGSSVRLPADVSPGSMRSDGGDALVVDAVDGAYRVADGRLSRITTGTVLGIAPRGWVVNECDDAHVCRLALVDRADGRRRLLGPGLAAAVGGSVDPAGRRAIVVESRDTRNVAFLVDLGDGSRTEIAGVSPVVGPTGTVNVVWSPDSRSFVVADAAVGVVGVDTATGHLTSLLAGGGPPLAIAGRTPIR